MDNVARQWLSYKIKPIRIVCRWSMLSCYVASRMSRMNAQCYEEINLAHKKITHKENNGDSGAAA